MIRDRLIEPHLLKLAKKYPILTITGPRQSGKTTLCQKLFVHKPYLSLEDLDVRRRASSDPRGFLSELRKGAVLDEIQRAPDLLSYLQTNVDQSRHAGRFILTGSAQFELLSQISQSLAGRTSLVTLLPFSLQEAYLTRRSLNLDKLLYTGFFPRIFDKRLEPTEAMASYCHTYIDRDVRSLINVKDLSKFELFLKLCANRTGQILNFSQLANDAGVNHNTASSWISVLETSTLVYRLKPHFNNLNKRLIKSPKVHLMDTALASYLMQIDTPKHLQHHPLKGNLFESFVVTELLKQRFNQVKPPHLYYWRDNTGHEVDVLMDFGDVLLPIEIKSGQTVASDSFKNLNYYRHINPKCKKAVLVYGGDQSYVENNTWVLSYKDLPHLTKINYRLRFS